jgi:hypothetical protein
MGIALWVDHADILTSNHSSENLVQVVVLGHIFAYALVGGLHNIERDALVQIDRTETLLSLNREQHTLSLMAFARRHIPNLNDFTIHHFTIVIFSKNKITNIHFFSLFLSLISTLYHGLFSLQAKIFLAFS